MGTFKLDELVDHFENYLPELPKPKRLWVNELDNPHACGHTAYFTAERAVEAAMRRKGDGTVARAYVELAPLLAALDGRLWRCMPSQVASRYLGMACRICDQRACERKILTRTIPV